MRYVRSKNANLARLTLGVKIPHEPKSTYVLGDAHSNPALIISACRDLEVMGTHLSVEQRDELVNLCMPRKHPVVSLEAGGKEQYKRDLARYRAILASVTYEPRNGELLLMGDTLCDRGADDMLVLDLYRELTKHGVQYSILASNHDNEFLKHYSFLKCKQAALSDGPKTPTVVTDPYGRSVTMNLPGDGKPINLEINLRNPAQQMQSLTTCETAIEQGCYATSENPDPEQAQKESEAFFIDAVEKYYLPALNLLNAHMEEDGKLVIYSHAPIDLGVLHRLCGLFGIQDEYNDSSTMALMETINNINLKFKEALQNGFFTKDKYFFSRFEKEGLKPSKEDPLFYCLWNRNDDTDKPDNLLDLPDSYPSHLVGKISWVHGHIGQRPLNPKKYPNYFNTDNFLGKGVDVKTTECHGFEPKPVCTHETHLGMAAILGNATAVSSAPHAASASGSASGVDPREEWKGMFLTEARIFVDYIKHCQDEQFETLRNMDKNHINFKVLSTITLEQAKQLVTHMEPFSKASSDNPWGQLYHGLLFIIKAHENVDLLLGDALPISVLPDFPLGSVDFSSYKDNEQLDNVAHTFTQRLVDHPQILASLTTAIHVQKNLNVENTERQIRAVKHLARNDVDALVDAIIHCKNNPMEKGIQAEYIDILQSLAPDDVAFSAMRSSVDKLSEALNALTFFKIKRPSALGKLSQLIKDKHRNLVSESWLDCLRYAPKKLLKTDLNQNSIRVLKRISAEKVLWMDDSHFAWISSDIIDSALEILRKETVPPHTALAALYDVLSERQRKEKEKAEKARLDSEQKAAHAQRLLIEAEEAKQRIMHENRVQQQRIEQERNLLIDSFRQNPGLMAQKILEGTEQVLIALNMTDSTRFSPHFSSIHHDWKLQMLASIERSPIVNQLQPASALTMLYNALKSYNQAVQEEARRREQQREAQHRAALEAQRLAALEAERLRALEAQRLFEENQRRWIDTFNVNLPTILQNMMSNIDNSGLYAALNGIDAHQVRIQPGTLMHLSLRMIDELLNKITASKPGSNTALSLLQNELSKKYQDMLNQEKEEAERQKELLKLKAEIESHLSSNDINKIVEGILSEQRNNYLTVLETIPAQIIPSLPIVHQYFNYQVKKLENILLDRCSPGKSSVLNSLLATLQNIENAHYFFDNAVTYSKFAPPPLPKGFVPPKWNDAKEGVLATDCRKKLIDALINYREARSANPDEQYGFFGIRRGKTRTEKLKAVDTLLAILFADKTTVGQADQFVFRFNPEQVDIYRDGHLGRTMRKILKDSGFATVRDFFGKLNLWGFNMPIFPHPMESPD